MLENISVIRVKIRVIRVRKNVIHLKDNSLNINVLREIKIHFVDNYWRNFSNSFKGIFAA